MQQPEYNIYETVSAYVKSYPRFTRYYVYENPIKQRIEGYEEINGKPRRFNNNDISSNTSLDDSIRRTKTTISDIVLCNDFNMFATFTFSPKKVDRANPIACKMKMAKWLKNQRDTYGKFQYLIIPEFHKDGKSLHFHAMLKDYKGQLLIATNAKTGKPLTQKGRQLYTFKSYKLGHSSLAIIPEEDIPQVSSYLKKYITKSMPEFKNKHRFWSSNDLQRPQ